MIKPIYFLAFISLSTNSLAHDISHTEPYIPQEISSIFWVDGDKGFLNGSPQTGYAFRLNDIDAPEINGVENSQCQKEHLLGIKSKNYSISKTVNTNSFIVRNFNGHDNNGYHFVDIILRRNGSDTSLSVMGKTSGHYQRWIHYGPKPIEEKPNWCSDETLPFYSLPKNRLPQIENLDDWKKQSKQNKFDYTQYHATMFLSDRAGIKTNSKLLENASKSFLQCINKRLKDYKKLPEMKEYLRHFGYPKTSTVMNSCWNKFSGLHWASENNICDVGTNLLCTTK